MAEKSSSPAVARARTREPIFLEGAGANSSVSDLRAPLQMRLEGGFLVVGYDSRDGHREVRVPMGNVLQLSLA